MCASPLAPPPPRTSENRGEEVRQLREVGSELRERLKGRVILL